MILKTLKDKNIAFAHIVFIVADNLRAFAFGNKNYFDKIVMVFNLCKVIVVRNIFHAVYLANIDSKRMILKVIIAFGQLHFGSIWLKNTKLSDKEIYA